MSSSLVTLGQRLLSDREKIVKSFPVWSKIDPDRFFRVLMVCFRQNNEIQSCTAESLYDCAQGIAQLGLDPANKGHVYIVRYGATAQLQVGYQGLLEIVRRKYPLAVAQARLVYEHDRFELEYGSNPSVLHTPTVRGERGEVIGAYSTVTIEGVRHIEYMTTADINKIRDLSKASRRGPWVDHWGEMARKTVFRRLVKWLPLASDPDIAQALRVDEENFDLDSSPNGKRVQASNVIDAFLEPEPQPVQVDRNDLPETLRPEADDNAPPAEDEPPPVDEHEAFLADLEAADSPSAANAVASKWRRQIDETFRRERLEIKLTALRGKNQTADSDLF